MIITKDNYTEKFDLFQESLQKSDFVSFDCEMTGVTHDLKTDNTKYDSLEFRYSKMRSIAQKFELIQLGLTLYIPNEKIDNIEKNTEANFYIERTFVFYLFKNSKLKFLTDLYSNDSRYNIFGDLTVCHPATLKFLTENNFDFKAIVNLGIHNNKLENISKIKELIGNYIENGKMSNSIVYLSESNELLLMNAIKTMTEFLSSQNIGKKKRIENLNPLVINFMLASNYKRMLKINGFNLLKDKTDSNSIIIEKLKQNLKLEDFTNTFESAELFNQKLTRDMLYTARYSTINMSYSDIDQVIEQEIGFSKYIKVLIEAKKPIIGHNLYFDLLFIYDKFIADLPEDYFTFINNIHECFPQICDTKYIASQFETKFENTKLDSLYKIIKRSKLDNFVNIKPDVVNGFAYYHDTEKANAFHDAGFDSIITGRCFVHILKSLENNFDINQTKQSLLDLTNEKFQNLINRTYLSMIEEPFGIIDFGEKIDAIISKAKEFKLEVFKMVKAVVYKPKDLTIYEMVKVLDNETYNISIVKIDDDKAFVEFFASRYDKDRNKIENGIENNDFELFIENLSKNETIEKILDYEEFEANLNNLIFT